jgi:hypothetical protein
VSDEAPLSRIADERGEHIGHTVSLVRLRTSRIEGFVISGPGTHEFVDVEVRTSKAAGELRDLFERIETRLRAAEEAVE